MGGLEEGVTSARSTYRHIASRLTVAVILSGAQHTCTAQQADGKPDDAQRPQSAHCSSLVLPLKQQHSPLYVSNGPLRLVPEERPWALWQAPLGGVRRLADQAFVGLGLPEVGRVANVRLDACLGCFGG